MRWLSRSRTASLSAERAVAETDARSSRPRVFCIGFNKTGTHSFHEAMTILRYDSLHWGGPQTARHVDAALESGSPLLSGLDPRYDAFSDVLPLTRNFARLDEQYPGSFFVLTVRPLDEWLDSRRRHVERNAKLKLQGKYDGTFLVVNEKRWREDWTRHLAHVREHFAGRARFLETDITNDPSWSGLCALLGVPEPAVPFPWANRDKGAHNMPSAG